MAEVAATLVKHDSHGNGSSLQKDPETETVASQSRNIVPVGTSSAEMASGASSVRPTPFSDGPLKPFTKPLQTTLKPNLPALRPSIHSAGNGADEERQAVHSTVAAKDSLPPVVAQSVSEDGHPLVDSTPPHLASPSSAPYSAEGVSSNGAAHVQSTKVPLIGESREGRKKLEEPRARKKLVYLPAGVKPRQPGENDGSPLPPSQMRIKNLIEAEPRIKKKLVYLPPSEDEAEDVPLVSPPKSTAQTGLLISSASAPAYKPTTRAKKKTFNFDEEADDSGLRDANPWVRVAAVLIDIAIVAVIGLLVLSYDRVAIAIRDTPELRVEQRVLQMLQRSSLGYFLTGVVVIQGVLLAWRAQTIGKFLMGLSVIDAANETHPGLFRILFLRSFVFLVLFPVLSAIGVYLFERYEIRGPELQITVNIFRGLLLLLNALDVIVFALGSGDALHDQLAETRVVYANGAPIVSLSK